MDVPIARLPDLISCIDGVKVRYYLAIAVVRHKDISDMVAGEYKRMVKRKQYQDAEDASVLSFVKGHTAVQKLLYGKYDGFADHRK